MHEEKLLRHCPQGCGAEMLPHHIAHHAKSCLFPFTYERIVQIVGHEGEINQCWTGRISIAFNGKPVRLYRLVDMALHGSIPPGILVCHHCDNRRCWNHNHLFRGTQYDNMQDCSDKGRLGGSVTWTREQRLSAGLDGSAARTALAARVSRYG